MFLHVRQVTVEVDVEGLGGVCVLREDGVGDAAVDVECSVIKDERLRHGCICIYIYKYTIGVYVC